MVEDDLEGQIPLLLFPKSWYLQRHCYIFYTPHLQHDSVCTLKPFTNYVLGFSWKYPFLSFFFFHLFFVMMVHVEFLAVLDLVSVNHVGFLFRNASALSTQSWD